MSKKYFKFKNYPYKYRRTTVHERVIAMNYKLMIFKGYVSVTPSCMELVHFVAVLCLSPKYETVLKVK